MTRSSACDTQTVATGVKAGATTAALARLRTTAAGRDRSNSPFTRVRFTEVPHPSQLTSRAWSYTEGPGDAHLCARAAGDGLQAAKLENFTEIGCTSQDGCEPQPLLTLSSKQVSEPRATAHHTDVPSLGWRERQWGLTVWLTTATDLHQSSPLPPWGQQAVAAPPHALAALAHAPGP